VRNDTNGGDVRNKQAETSVSQCSFDVGKVEGGRALNHEQKQSKTSSFVSEHSGGVYSRHVKKKHKKVRRKSMSDGRRVFAPPTSVAFSILNWIMKRGILMVVVVLVVVCKVCEERAWE
jgi:hypothetical protein